MAQSGLTSIMITRSMPHFFMLEQRRGEEVYSNSEKAAFGITQKHNPRIHCRFLPSSTIVITLFDCVGAQQRVRVYTNGSRPTPIWNCTKSSFTLCFVQKVIRKQNHDRKTLAIQNCLTALRMTLGRLSFRSREHTNATPAGWLPAGYKAVPPTGKGCLWRRKKGPSNATRGAHPLEVVLLAVLLEDAGEERRQLGEENVHAKHDPLVEDGLCGVRDEISPEKFLHEKETFGWI